MYGRAPFKISALRWIALFVLLCFVLSGCSNAKPSADRLGADLGFTKQHLIIKNGDSFVWKDVTITINKEYIYKVKWIPRGSSSFHYREFLNRLGNAYDPSTFEILRVEILVPDTGNGKPGRFIW